MEKTATKAQVLLESLMPALVSAVDRTFMKHCVLIDHERKSIDAYKAYLGALRTTLLQKNCADAYDEALFKGIYDNAFYTGPIPKNKNHIIIKASVGQAGAPNTTYQIWIDLDKIVNTLKKHYQITPSKSLSIEKFRVTKSDGHIDSRSFSLNTAINSQWERLLDYKLLYLIFTFQTVGTLIFVILALTSLITVPPTLLIVPELACTLSSGLTAYCFFNMGDKRIFGIEQQKTDSASEIVLRPINLDDFFTTSRASAAPTPS